jgi:hypothetical protein
MVSSAPDSRKWPNPVLYKIVHAKRLLLARLPANFGTAKLFHSAALERAENATRNFSADVERQNH